MRISDIDNALAKLRNTQGDRTVLAIYPGDEDIEILYETSKGELESFVDKVEYEEE